MTIRTYSVSHLSPFPSPHEKSPSAKKLIPSPADQVAGRFGVRSPPQSPRGCTFISPVTGLRRCSGTVHSKQQDKYNRSACGREWEGGVEKITISRQKKKKNERGGNITMSELVRTKVNHSEHKAETTIIKTFEFLWVETYTLQYFLRLWQKIQQFDEMYIRTSYRHHPSNTYPTILRSILQMPTKPNIAQDNTYPVLHHTTHGQR
jgi:hypothetical protein